ncbi:Hypothetical predicted protein [Olea europaea subsp. europaea]|uniref:Uncharacterized protein n=1 Tax=Olea europaea subsp. europaea TaxID=158383 RepID=A0A8S0S9I8_OLEEU|nr:Hypothetical predicted protein [Olea europaea subsp. europaea]
MVGRILHEEFDTMSQSISDDVYEPDMSVISNKRRAATKLNSLYSSASTCNCNSDYRCVTCDFAN